MNDPLNPPPTRTERAMLEQERIEIRLINCGIGTMLVADCPRCGFEAVIRNGKLQCDCQED